MANHAGLSESAMRALRGFGNNLVHHSKFLNELSLYPAAFPCRRFFSERALRYSWLESKVLEHYNTLQEFQKEVQAGTLTLTLDEVKKRHDELMGNLHEWISTLSSYPSKHLKLPSSDKDPPIRHSIRARLQSCRWSNDATSLHGHLS